MHDQKSPGKMAGEQSVSLKYIHFHFVSLWSILFHFKLVVILSKNRFSPLTVLPSVKTNRIRILSLDYLNTG